jgi:hypothetical protein
MMLCVCQKVRDSWGDSIMETPEAEDINSPICINLIRFVQFFFPITHTIHHQITDSCMTIFGCSIGEKNQLLVL